MKNLITLTLACLILSSCVTTNLTGPPAKPDKLSGEAYNFGVMGNLDFGIAQSEDPAAAIDGHYFVEKALNENHPNQRWYLTPMDGVHDLVLASRDFGNTREPYTVPASGLILFNEAYPWTDASFERAIADGALRALHKG